MRTIKANIPFTNRTANGLVTFNGSVFKEKELRKVLSEYKQQVESGRGYGEINHDPEYAETILNKISHKVNTFDITKDGVDMEIEVLDTPEGTKFQYILMAKDAKKEGFDISSHTRMLCGYDKNKKIWKPQTILSVDFTMIAPIAKHK